MRAVAVQRVERVNHSMTLLAVDSIRTDGGTQTRAHLNPDTVADYAADMLAGASFPPITVFHDGEAYWLADGFHRVSAAKQAALEALAADIRQGTRRDAVLFSVGANAAHGLRRTNQDKRRAVEMVLHDDEWRQWSNREIARRCGVSLDLVNRMRDESSLNESFSEDRTYTTRHGTVATMHTANIGQAPTETPAAPSPLPFEPTTATDLEEDDDAPLTHYEETIAAAYAPPAVHQLLTSSESNEWYTPAPYIEAARRVMGGIDLDPASNELANRTIRAAHFYSRADDGFSRPWGSVNAPSRVWLNPPYGKEGNESNAARWSRRLLDAYQLGHVSEAVLLVNASTGDGWFAPLKQFPICFPDNRIRFYNAGGEASQPTHSNALIYLGPNVGAFVAVFSEFGAVMARLAAYDGHVFVEGLEAAA